MAKDFSDYVAVILEAEKRVYHIYHYRAKTSMDVETITHNGRDYIFDRDRSFRVKWAPWKKVDWKHPIVTINELVRSKKIGLLLYHEPIKGEPLIREVEHKTPKEYVCKVCGFTTVHNTGIKAHIKQKHKRSDFGAATRVGFEVSVEKIPYYPSIHPFHISRIHQPSGEMRP